MTSSCYGRHFVTLWNQVESKCGSHIKLQTVHSDLVSYYFVGSVHACDLLGVNYCVNYSLNNGSYCKKGGTFTHSNFACTEKFHNALCIQFLLLRGLKRSHNHSRLMNRMCEYIFNTQSQSHSHKHRMNRP